MKKIHALIFACIFVSAAINSMDLKRAHSAYDPNEMYNISGDNQNKGRTDHLCSDKISWKGKNNKPQEHDDEKLSLAWYQNGSQQYVQLHDCVLDSLPVLKQAALNGKKQIPAKNLNALNYALFKDFINSCATPEERQKFINNQNSQQLSIINSIITEFGGKALVPMPVIEVTTCGEQKDRDTVVTLAAGSLNSNCAAVALPRQLAETIPLFISKEKEKNNKETALIVPGIERDDIQALQAITTYLHFRSSKNVVTLHDFMKDQSIALLKKVVPALRGLLCGEKIIGVDGDNPYMVIGRNLWNKYGQNMVNIGVVVFLASALWAKLRR